MRGKVPNDACGPAAPLRLLIADDDPNDVELCLRALKNSGLAFSADYAFTREDFGRRLREQPVDIVLADYQMKGWNGMDALAIVRQVCPTVPLILVSGTLGEE